MVYLTSLRHCDTGFAKHFSYVADSDCHYRRSDCWLTFASVKKALGQWHARSNSVGFEDT